MTQIKLASFNLGLGATKFLPENYSKQHVEKNLQRIAGLLGKHGIDVAGMQEVDVKTNRSRGVDEPSFLRDAQGWPTRSSRFHPGIDFDGGEFGNAVLVNLSKPELSYKDEKIQRRRFPKITGREDRSALAVRVDLEMPPGHAREYKNLWFVTTHFDIPFTDWMHQLCAILDWARGFSFPVLICGDFNVVERVDGKRTAEYRLMNETFEKFGFSDYGPLGPDNSTFPRAGKRKIDYLYLRDDRGWFEVTAAKRVRPKLGDYWLSDHWMLTCTLSY